MENSKDKKHADFQDDYRRSSNFNKPIKEEEFEIEGDGELKLDAEKKENKDKTLTAADKKKIEEAMDSFKERTEITPGGEQTDKK